MNNDYSSDIVESIERCLRKNGFYDGENAIWFSWIGDGHSFLIDGPEGGLYRINVYKENREDYVGGY